MSDIKAKQLFPTFCTGLQFNIEKTLDMLRKKQEIKGNNEESRRCFFENSR